MLVAGEGRVVAAGKESHDHERGEWEERGETDDGAQPPPCSLDPRVS
jgi:hypothetical protein